MKETKVVKFGGSSLADAKQFKKVAEQICFTNAMKWHQKDRTLMSSSR